MLNEFISIRILGGSLLLTRNFYWTFQGLDNNVNGTRKK